MREKKFRVWDKFEEKMIYYHSIWEHSRPTHKATTRPHGVLHSFLNDIELMQYTGLKDKNKKVWFEKDIIKHINANAGYGDSNQPDYLYTIVPDIEDLYDEDYLVFCMKSGENVGNIYENAELLV